MTAGITVDPASAVPPFEQIRQQVTVLVAQGQLRPGDRLPTVRRLAADLGLAPGTVSRAYRELEGGGWITTRRGAGTRVADPTPVGSNPAGTVAAERAVAELVDGMLRSGVPAAVVARILRETAEQLPTSPSDGLR